MWRRAILFSVRGVIRLLSKSWNADRLSHTSDNVNEGLESQRPGPSLSCVVAEERILDHLTTPPTNSATTFSSSLHHAVQHSNRAA